MHLHRGMASARGLGVLAVALFGLTWSICLVAVRDTSLAQPLSNIGLWLVALVAGGVAVLRGFRHVGADRRFWLLLGGAALSWSAGQASWTWYESVLGREIPFPSLADVGYLGLPVLAAASLLALPVTAPTTAGQVRTLLDGLMVAASLLLCSWVLVLRHVFDAEARLFHATILLAYPIGDVVVITMVVTAWLSTRHRDEDILVPLPLVGTGLLALAIADSGFSYATTVGSYRSGSIIDLGWFFGFSLILVAALGARPPGIGSPDEDRRSELGMGSLLPYAAVCLALLTSAIDVWRAGSADLVVSWIRTLLLFLLVGRQVLTMLENHALTRHLEDRVALRTAELQASEQRFLALVRHSSDVVTVVSRAGVVQYQSGSIERILGYRPEDVENRPVYDLMGPDEAVIVMRALEHAAERNLRIHTVHTAWRHAAGHLCRVEVTITNLLDDPHVQGLVLNTRDITDRVLLEEQLTSMAFTDSLTELPNRALFKDRLQHALSRRSSTDSTVSVLFMDLDGFKSVNDMLGHGAGDDLLVQVADRLRTVVRDGDTVARFGGDEFAVLMEGGAGGDHETRLAHRINLAVREPFDLRGEIVHVTASIGIARMDRNARTAEQLLRNADLAMYQAKAARAGGYAVFVPEMHAGLVERVRLEGDLRKAVEHEQFVLHFQPMVSMRTGQVTGVEALVRWQHPERGLLPPADFIAVAEATGLIRPMGLWVMRESCLQVRRWQAGLAGPARLRISVNVSPRQLHHGDFTEQVRAILIETGLPPAQLTLEMTESVLIDDRDQTMRVLTDLHDLGVRLAIDDFGTGYSSLSYLHRFPVDVLKIDRSFVERLSSGGDTALVSTILRLGHSLQLETVAEGIERPQEMLMLRRQGCTTGQGYHFSPPVPAAVMSGLLGVTADGSQRADEPTST